MQTMEVRHVPFANPVARRLDVRLAADALVSLPGADDRRARDGRLHPADRRRAADDPGALTGSREPQIPVLDSPWFWVHVSSLLFCLRQLRAWPACWASPTCCSSRRSRRSTSATSTRGCRRCRSSTRMNSRAVTIGWLFLTIGVVVGVVWTAQARTLSPDNIEPPGDVAGRSEDLHRRPHLGGLLVRRVRAQDDGLERTARGVALGGRASSSCCSTSCRSATSSRTQPHVSMIHDDASVPARRQSPDGAGRPAGTARLLEPRRRRRRRGACRAVVGGRVGRAVDVQPLRDLRGQHRAGARPGRDRRVPQRVSRAARRDASRRICSRSPTPTRRSICSASPPASTRWSSASRRSSGRSRTRSRPRRNGAAPARC